MLKAHERNTKKLLKHRKQVSKDCWSMDHAWFKWMDEHLKTYLKEAGRVVDLDYYSFTVNGETLTQRQTVEKMIELVERILDMQFYHNEKYMEMDIEEYQKLFEDTKNELCDWWKETVFAMWW